jgi:1-acyl-sn-glycerol-3-phosphate acyltransferase
VTSGFSWLIIFFTFIRYKIYGKSNLHSNTKNPVIFVINHSSFIDIPMVEVVLGARPRVWLSRRLFGLNTLLKRMHVIVARKGHSNAKYALKKAISLAYTHKSDITIFPEGTRHADGKIHTFFSGFVVMAQELDRPVIPIALSGLNSILPPKSFLIDSDAQMVKISIGKPINHKDFETQKEFITHVQNWFEQELGKLNNV